MKSALRFFTIPLLLLAFGLSLSGCGGDSSSGGTSGKPAAPTNVTVTPGDGKATVKWDPVSGATSYTIYYSTTKGASDGSKAASGKIENATSPYVVTGLTNGVTYYFTVTAVNSQGESGASEEPSTVPVPGPTSPTDVSVAGGNGQISVTWGAVTDADSYNVYYGTSSGVTKITGIKIANAVSPQVVSGLQNGTTYYVVVTAVNEAGESAESAEKSATPSSSVQPPASPTGITAVGSDKKATIHFNMAPGATAYNIYYSTTAGVTKTTGIKLANVGSPTTIGDLTNFTTYYFVVTAVGPGGESAESVEKSATPYIPPTSIPSGVTATPGNGKVTVTWGQVSGATSYNIYYSTKSGVKKTTGTQVANATAPRVITGLTNSTTYYFVVTAVGPAGESAESAEASAMPVPPPAKPSGISVTPTPANGNVTVTWNAVTGATSYNVYYSTTAGVTKTNGAKFPGAISPQVISGLTNGQVYFFVVTAVGSGGESVESSEKYATPSLTPQAPASPTGRTLTPVAGGVTVGWKTQLTATSYTIYYAAGYDAVTNPITAAALKALNNKVTVAALSADPQPTNQSYNVTGLTPGTSYAFIITASNAIGESGTQANAAYAIPQ